MIPARLAAALASSRLRVRLGGEAQVTPSQAVVVLNRTGYGPRPGDVETYEALGASQRQRLEAHVEQQLHPEEIADGESEARLGGFITLTKTKEQLWTDHVASDPDWRVRVQPAVETELAAFVRATWSRRQLIEVLGEFWRDHFNVYGWDYISSPNWVYWERDVIRGNALGNFRTMLGMVAKAPAMLVYLDNYTSSAAGPNENYARELFELHTMGAEHYFGVTRQDAVPLDDEGRPVAFVDDDVYEATRCFTGWTFDEETGAPRFRAEWHDRFQKHVLLRYFPANQPPFADGEGVLDLLAEHPATARHIALKLCRRLLADEPPASVVEAAAAIFHAQRDAPDQLRQVVRTILLAPELTEHWGAKTKRPFEVVVSALRATATELQFTGDDDLTNTLLWLFDATGHALFSWRPPDGYPDRSEDWLSSATLVPTWRLVNWLADAGRDGVHAFDLETQMPAGVSTPGDLADFWIQRILGHSMTASGRQEIVDLLAQGRNPSVPLRIEDDDVRHRIRATVGVLLMTPDFLLR